MGFVRNHNHKINPHPCKLPRLGFCSCNQITSKTHVIKDSSPFLLTMPRMVFSRLSCFPGTSATEDLSICPHYSVTEFPALHTSLPYMFSQPNFTSPFQSFPPPKLDRIPSSALDLFLFWTICQILPCVIVVLVVLFPELNSKLLDGNKCILVIPKDWIVSWMFTLFRAIPTRFYYPLVNRRGGSCSELSEQRLILFPLSLSTQ